MGDDLPAAKTSDMPLSFWINVALSFVFVFLGVGFVLWSTFWKFGRDWIGAEYISTVGWAILAIGVVVGLFNAFRYYTGSKANASKG